VLATLDGAAAAIRETIASRTAPFDVAITCPLLQRSRASGSEERWRRCRDHGQALRPAEAVALALVGCLVTKICNLTA